MSAPPAGPRRREPAPPHRGLRGAVASLLEDAALAISPGMGERVTVPSHLVDRAMAASERAGWGRRRTREGVVRLLLIRAVRDMETRNAALRRSDGADG